MKKKNDLCKMLFIACRVTEIIESSPDAVEQNGQALFFEHPYGNIIVNFEDESLTIVNNEHHRFILDALHQLCRNYDFEIYLTNQTGDCQCEECLEKKTQLN